MSVGLEDCVLLEDEASLEASIKDWHFKLMVSLINGPVDQLIGQVIHE